MRTFNRICWVLLIILVLLLGLGCRGYADYCKSGAVREFDREVVGKYAYPDVIDEADFSADDLGNGIVIVRVFGEVTGANGDGRVIGEDSEYNYINYKNVGFSFFPGDQIVTYLVFLPGALDVDDIYERYDFLITD